MKPVVVYTRNISTFSRLVDCEFSDSLSNGVACNYFTSSPVYTEMGDRFTGMPSVGIYTSQPPRPTEPPSVGAISTGDGVCYCVAEGPVARSAGILIYRMRRKKRIPIFHSYMIFGIFMKKSTQSNCFTVIMLNILRYTSRNLVSRHHLLQCVKRLLFKNHEYYLKRR